MHTITLTEKELESIKRAIRVSIMHYEKHAQFMKLDAAEIAVKQLDEWQKLLIILSK